MTTYKAIKVLPKTKALLDSVFPEFISYDNAVKILILNYLTEPRL